MRGLQILAGTAFALAACTSDVPAGIDSGPPECQIAGGIYQPGDLNPADGCQICNPSLATTAWTSQPDLTDCRASATGTFCQLGKCVNGCGIGGLVVLAGAADPDDACQICVPTQALDAWSPNPTCADAGIPDAGPPDAGIDGGPGIPDAGEDAGPPTCLIGGVAYSAGEAVGACQVCDPDAGATAGQPLADGTLCDAGGNVCIGGACSPGCWIGGALVKAHTFQAIDQDSCCNPGVNPAGWTAGFAALPSIGGTGVSAIAAAAVTDENAQILVGNASGAVTLYTQLSDGGFGSQFVINAGASVKAVAAADVSGDGLVDVLYETSTSPSLVAQTAGHAFGTAKTWPAIRDGGGLWVERSDAGPQVLSFELLYSSAKFSSFPSYMQPQIDSSGQLQDSCQVAVGECLPTQLAFGSFRNAGGIELVLTCMQPDLGSSDADSETFYGAWTPGQCNDQPGWQMGQFVFGDFSTGAVIGPVVAAGDLNGDGLSEVVGGGKSEIDLQMNWGPAFGTFYSGRVTVPLVPGADVTALQIANLRADAGGNILALDPANSELEVYYPRPPYDAGVTLTGKYPMVAGATGMVTGDFDGDGRPDVAVGSASGIEVFHRQCP